MSKDLFSKMDGSKDIKESGESSDDEETIYKKGVM